MKSKDFKMPAFGVGPFYVISCLLLTIVGLYLHFNGFLSAGEYKREKTIFIIIGLISILCGLYLWIQAVIIDKINKKVRENKLITTGVYSLVRNPVYTAFIFIFTGIIFMAANFFLLILPLVFWIFLTILMKYTEEKWLMKKFGKKYELYCSEVNRTIPWFKKRN